MSSELPFSPDISFGVPAVKQSIEKTLETFENDDGTPCTAIILNRSQLDTQISKAYTAGITAAFTNNIKTATIKLLHDNPKLAIKLAGPVYGPAYGALASLIAESPGSDRLRPTNYSITVNPRDGTDLFKFMRLIGKCLDKGWIGDGDPWLYAIEQRSVEHPAFGMHCHIFLHRPDRTVDGDRHKNHSAFCTEIRSTFKSVVDFPMHVKINGITPGTEERVIAYMKGDKKDPEKMKKVEYDRVWRKEVKLQDYYYNSDAKFPCSIEEVEEKVEEEEEDDEDDLEEDEEDEEAGDGSGDTDTELAGFIGEVIDLP